MHQCCYPSSWRTPLYRDDGEGKTGRSSSVGYLFLSLVRNSHGRTFPQHDEGRMACSFNHVWQPNFALFPVMICAIAFMGTFLLPLIQESFPTGDLVILIHAQYLMLGLMVCFFGLMGNEVMNRRFGQASLLAFSARTLPLSPKRIFTIFVIKDLLYYFILWILPLGAGFSLVPYLQASRFIIRQ